MSADGRDTTQVTRGRDDQYWSPEWTPDGRYIVVTKVGGTPTGKLWLFHVDGGSGIPLIREPAGLVTLGAALTPGRPLHLVRPAPGGLAVQRDPSPDPARDVRPRDRPDHADVGSVRLGVPPRDLARWQVPGLRHPPRRRDRASWCATSPRATSGGSPIRCSATTRKPRPTSISCPGYSFTPDGRALVMSYGGEIWRVPTDGGAAARIAFTADVDVAVGPRSALRVPGRRLADAGGEADPRSGAFARWTPARVLRAQSHLGPRPGRFDAAAADVARRRRVLSRPGRPTASGSRTCPGAKRAGTSGRPGATGAGSRCASPASPPPTMKRRGRPMAGGSWRSGPIRASSARPCSASAAGSPPDSSGCRPMAARSSVIAPSGGRSQPHFTTDTTRIFAYSGGDGLVSFRWDGSRSAQSSQGHRSTAAGRHRQPAARVGGV